jgi:hypothetical protein
MHLDVVWDGPPGPRLRAVSRRVPSVLGAILVCFGAAAVLPLLTLTIAVGIYLIVWLDFRNHPEKVWPDWFQGVRGSLVPLWLLALVATTVGVVLGLRLLRGNRHLILFLRRFGYRPATHTVTEATVRLGDFWRVITLDDDQIEPLAAGTGVEGFVEAVSGAKRRYRSAAPAAVRGWKFGMWAAVVALGVGLVFVISPGPDWTARLDRLKALVDLGQGPDGIAALSARLAAAILVTGLVLVVAWFALVVVGSLVSLPIRLVYGGVSRGVTKAADSDALHVVEPDQIGVVKAVLEEQRRRVFGARLCVVTVNSAVWQQTVSELADVCAVPLIDISEPTESLMWEIEELTRRFGDRCVFIGAYDRLQELIDHDGDDRMRRLSTLLDGRRVVAYTPEGRNTRRFVRALSSTLDRHVRRPMPISSAPRPSVHAGPRPPYAATGSTAGAQRARRLVDGPEGEAQSSPTVRRTVRPNRASEAVDDAVHSIDAGDVARVAARCVPECVIVEHHPHRTLSLEDFLAALVALTAAPSRQASQKLIATLGELLSLHRIVIATTAVDPVRPGVARLDCAAVVEVDGSGRIVRLDMYDAERLDDARRQLTERYTETRAGRAR